jgi:hypothetical protein
MHDSYLSRSPELGGFIPANQKKGKFPRGSATTRNSKRVILIRGTSPTLLLIDFALPYIMKLQTLSGLLFVQALTVNAFEIPFQLPFGLSQYFPIGKGSDKPELFAFHKAIIEIPSVTGNEHNVGVYIADYLKKRNYTVERIPSTPPLKRNLISSNEGILTRERLCVSWEG